MKTFKITQEIRDGILQYLSQRPYAEVAEGIRALANLEEIEKVDKEEEK